MHVCLYVNLFMLCQQLYTFSFDQVKSLRKSIKKLVCQTQKLKQG